MALEIERKFLVLNSDYKKHARGELLIQGYLSTRKECVVRVRIAGNNAFLTIKGQARSLTRSEFEYPIPVNDAKALLNLCEYSPIEKIRYRVPYQGMIWEVDEFIGLNQGLVVAEIELESEDQIFDKPHWIGGEVTLDPRYANSSLTRFPFSTW